jgi:hypothetical protein
MRFHTYLALRVLRALLTVLTVPFWAPVIMVIVLLFWIVESFAKWLRIVRRDWIRRS